MSCPSGALFLDPFRQSALYVYRFRFSSRGGLAAPAPVPPVCLVFRLLGCSRVCLFRKKPQAAVFMLFLGLSHASLVFQEMLAFFPAKPRFRSGFVSVGGSNTSFYHASLLVVLSTPLPLLYFSFICGRISGALGSPLLNSSLPVCIFSNLQYSFSFTTSDYHLREVWVRCSGN